MLRKQKTKFVVYLSTESEEVIVGTLDQESEILQDFMLGQDLEDFDRRVFTGPISLNSSIRVVSHVEEHTE